MSLLRLFSNGCIGQYLIMMMRITVFSMCAQRPTKELSRDGCFYDNMEEPTGGLIILNNCVTMVMVARMCKTLAKVKNTNKLKKHLRIH